MHPTWLLRGPEPFGADGMGQIYRSRDSTPGCDLAIKVLPEAFAGDLERLARFDRETPCPCLFDFFGLFDQACRTCMTSSDVRGRSIR